MIARYPKPYVALCQGLVMGGGVGVAGHGSHRVVGDTTGIAMPECGIGLVPDVGSSLLLAQAPGRSASISGSPATAWGRATPSAPASPTPSCPRTRWPELVAAPGGGPATRTRSPPSRRRAPPAALAADQERIDDAFSAPDLATLAARLEASDWGHGVLKLLLRRSPLAMACTLELVRAARREPGIEKALVRERRATWRCISDGDLLEGIRAQVIDKDRDPVWRDTLDSLRREQVAAMLAPLGPHELVLPPAPAG